MTPPTLAGLITKYKLEAHADRIQRGLVPAFRISTSQSGPNPSSRFGGLPDLAKPDAWPQANAHPLHFLGQLRLSELPRGHIPNLPAQGWLRFWYDTVEEGIREFRTEIDATAFDPPVAHVTFDPDESRPVSPREWPEVPENFEQLWCDWEPFPEVSLSFDPIWCLDHAATKEVFDAEDRADRKTGWERCFGLLGELEHRQNNRPNHRLLGDLYEMQSNNRFAAACAAAGVAEFADHSDTQKAALDKAALDYRLLFLLDSDPDGPGFTWGDAGSLQWWIKQQDFAAGQLDRAVGIYEQGG